ncbi:hypothetical protein ACO22_07155, partial [Paracoccidioides brasiliensis]
GVSSFSNGQSSIRKFDFAFFVPPFKYYLANHIIQQPRAETFRNQTIIHVRSTQQRVYGIPIESWAGGIHWRQRPNGRLECYVLPPPIHKIHRVYDLHPLLVGFTPPIESPKNIIIPREQRNLRRQKQRMVWWLENPGSGTKRVNALVRSRIEMDGGSAPRDLGSSRRTAFPVGAFKVCIVPRFPPSPNAHSAEQPESNITKCSSWHVGNTREGY